MEAYLDKNNNKVVYNPDLDYEGVIDIPDNATEIDAGAFLNCKDITKITMGDNITSIGDSAFEGCINLREIVLSKNLQKIGKFAFYNCKRLNKIELPGSEMGNGMDNIIKLPKKITQIGRSAFQNCESIKKVQLPYKIERIEAWTFSGCKELKNINLGDAINYIGSQAFAWCNNLEKLTILSPKITLGYEVFYNILNKIFKIKLPLTCNLESVFDLEKRQCEIFKFKNLDYISYEGIKYRKIENNDNRLKIIANNDLIGHIDIPTEFEFNNIKYKVTEISASAFESCTDITSVYIGKTIETIESKAFANCKSLTNFIVNSHNKVYCSDESNRAIIRIKDKSLLFYAIGSEIDNYIIPKDIDSIAEGAFMNFQYLEQLTFLKTTPPTIGNTTFDYGLSNQCKVFVPKGSKKAYEESLAKWWSKNMIFELDKFTQDDIEYRIIKYKGIENAVEISNGKNAKTKELEIQKSVRFYDVDYNVVKIGDSAFFNNKKIEKITLPDTIKEIGNDAFNSCSNLTVDKLPSSLISIGATAFADVKFRNFKLPLSLQTIGSSAFSNSTIDSDIIEIPKATSSIENNPFLIRTISHITVDKDNLNYTSDNNGVLYTKDFKKIIAFPSGSKIKNYSINKKTEIIGTNSFRFCRNLVINTLPDMLKSIEENAFMYIRFSQIKLPPSLQSIGKNAFSYCRVASDSIIEIPTATNNIENQPFYNTNISRINVNPSNSKYASDQSGVLYSKDFKKLIAYPSGSLETSYIIHKKTETIGVSSFYMAKNLKKITIPDSVNKLETNCFHLSGLLRIIVKPATPPKTIHSFTKVSSSCKIIASKNIESNYKIVEEWKEFEIINNEVPDMYFIVIPTIRDQKNVVCKILWELEKKSIIVTREWYNKKTCFWIKYLYFEDAQTIKALFDKLRIGVTIVTKDIYLKNNVEENNKPEDPFDFNLRDIKKGVHYIVIPKLGNKEKEALRLLWELEKKSAIITREWYNKKLCFWIKEIALNDAIIIKEMFKKIGVDAIIETKTSYVENQRNPTGKIITGEDVPDVKEDKLTNFDIGNVNKGEHYIVIPKLGDKEKDALRLLWELEKKSVAVTREWYNKKMCFWIKAIDQNDAIRIKEMFKKIGVDIIIETKKTYLENQ